MLIDEYQLSDPAGRSGGSIQRTRLECGDVVSKQVAAQWARETRMRIRRWTGQRYREPPACRRAARRKLFGSPSDRCGSDRCRLTSTNDLP
jgi:hypothetical protein